MISPNGYIIDENGEFSPNGYIDFEKDISEFEKRCDEIKTMMHEIIRSETQRSFDPDTPLRLEFAICLPILGGEIRQDGSRIPSPNFSRRTLLSAINRGELKSTKRMNKFLVSENQLKEWLTWQENSQEQGFGSNQSDIISQAAQPRRHGTFATPPSTESPLKSRQESALARLMKSKEERLRSQNI